MAAIDSPDRFTVGMVLLIAIAAAVLLSLWHRVVQEERRKAQYSREVLADLKRRAREVGVR